MLPNYMCFRFLLCNHNFAIMEVVKSTESQKCISTFYNMLLVPSATKLAYGIKPLWENYVGTMDDKWSEALDTCKAVSPKLSDRGVRYAWCKM